MPPGDVDVTEPPPFIQEEIANWKSKFGVESSDKKTKNTNADNDIDFDDSINGVVVDDSKARKPPSNVHDPDVRKNVGDVKRITNASSKTSSCLTSLICSNVVGLIAFVKFAVL